MASTTLAVTENSDSDDEYSVFEANVYPSEDSENNELVVSIISKEEEEEDDDDDDYEDDEEDFSDIETEVVILTEKENETSLISDTTSKRKALKSSWWNVLRGLITLLVCFVGITTFSFIDSDEPWAGVSILLLTFSLIGFYISFQLHPL